MLRAANMAYTDLSEHQWMIEDSVRTGAYEEAIRRIVRPGDVVLDFGCGLGILGMIAARAGARVYAVDRLPIVRLAKAIAKKNGIDDIEFVFAPDGGFALPERVDVIVSEWMGHFGLHEGMLGPLCAARDAHLKEGGRMIPERVVMKAGLVREPRYHERRRVFKNTICGIDFSPAAEWVFGEVVAERMGAEDLAWPSATVAELGMGRVVGMPRVMEGAMVPEAGAVVNGLAGWFEVDLGAGVGFDTRPGAPETHWAPLYFPFAEPMKVTAGRPVTVRFWPVQLDVVHTGWRWWAGDGESSREGDDLTWRAYLKRPLPAGLVR